MAKPILATTPLTYNDIDSLAELFSNAFLHLNEYQTLSKQPQQKHLFFQNVNTAVGLAFTAVLAEQDLLSLFKPYLDNFLQYQVDNGDQDASGMSGIAMGDIISLGSDAFRTLNHPEYYHYFLQALRDSLRYILVELNLPKSSGIDRVVELIMADE